MAVFSVAVSSRHPLILFVTRGVLIPLPARLLPMVARTNKGFNGSIKAVERLTSDVRRKRCGGIDREGFLVSFFLCDLSGLGVRRSFAHAEDANGAKAGAGGPWHRRPSRRVRRSWPEIILRGEHWIA